LRSLKSTVNTAVLSLVIARPSTAYEVGRRFVGQFGSLFASSQRNVYTTLERLEAQSLIERFGRERAAGEPVAPEPPAHLRATAAGARAYRGWLASPLEGGTPYGALTDPGVARRDVLVRLQAVRPDDLDTIAAILDAYEGVLLQHLRQPRAADGSLLAALLHDERALGVQVQLQWVATARGRLRDAAHAAGPAAGEIEAPLQARRRQRPRVVETAPRPVERRSA
jgi:hypothetical protein